MLMLKKLPAVFASATVLTACDAMAHQDDSRTSSNPHHHGHDSQHQHHHNDSRHRQHRNHHWQENNTAQAPRPRRRPLLAAWSRQ